MGSHDKASLRTSARIFSSTTRITFMRVRHVQVNWYVHNVAGELINDTRPLMRSLLSPLSACAQIINKTMQMSLMISGFWGGIVVEILGISGSPVKNSNTDRLVKLVQDSTGLKSEFIKLFDCKIEPCHVCMWMTLNGEGFFHARTSRRGINTIFDHFRDKPARYH